jgi:sodium/hydrogen antiporter
MGMGHLAKDKAPEGASGDPSGAAAAKGGRAWPGFGILAGGDPTERARKKSIAEEEQAADDRHIRFTIGGVGQRLTKEDFIKRMQGLDEDTRREVVDQSSASHVVKTLARQDPHRHESVVSEVGVRRDDEEAGQSSSKSSSQERPRRSESLSPTRKPGESSRSHEEPETAVERRRRLAALASTGEEIEGETPAERRRREAALGMTADDDSDEDETTERVLPARKGIRFAEAPERGRT